MGSKDATNGTKGIATNGARTLLKAPGLTNRSKKPLGKRRPPTNLLVLATRIKSDSATAQDSATIFFGSNQGGRMEGSKDSKQNYTGVFSRNCCSHVHMKKGVCSATLGGLLQFFGGRYLRRIG